MVLLFGVVGVVNIGLAVTALATGITWFVVRRRKPGA
jgi:hypothetical protein